MWDEIILTIVDVLVPAVLALLGALLAYAVIYVKQRTEAIKNENVRKMVNDALDRARVDIYEAVAYVAQTYVDGLKAAREDGKLTPEEKAEAFARAKAAFKARMGEAGLRQLAEIVGDLEEWLRTQIEAAVYDLGKAS